MRFRLKKGGGSGGAAAPPRGGCGGAEPHCVRFQKTLLRGFIRAERELSAFSFFFLNRGGRGRGGAAPPAGGGLEGAEPPHVIV